MVVDGQKTSATYPPTAGATDDRDDDDFFPVHDRLGSIVCLMRGHSPRASGSSYITADRSYQEYDAFGRVVRSTGLAPDVVPFQYGSKFTDNETGLNYYGYRYYDPQNGRWLSRDPIGERGGVNLYGMVGNNPVNLIDVLGLNDFWDNFDKVEPPKTNEYGQTPLDEEVGNVPAPPQPEFVGPPTPMDGGDREKPFDKWPIHKPRDCEREAYLCAQRGGAVCAVAGKRFGSIGAGLVGGAYAKACFDQKRSCDKWNKDHGF